MRLLAGEDGPAAPGMSITDSRRSAQFKHTLVWQVATPWPKEANDVNVGSQWTRPAAMSHSQAPSPPACSASCKRLPRPVLLDWPVARRPVTAVGGS